MAKIDEVKEFITTLRVYLNFILVIVLSIGTGLVKLYLSGTVGILFYVGAVIIFIFMFGFIKINKKLHQEIKGFIDGFSYNSNCISCISVCSDHRL